MNFIKKLFLFLCFFGDTHKGHGGAQISPTSGEKNIHRDIGHKINIACRCFCTIVVELILSYFIFTGITLKQRWKIFRLQMRHKLFIKCVSRKVRWNGMLLHPKSLEFKLIFLSVSTSRASSNLTCMIWGEKEYNDDKAARPDSWVIQIRHIASFGNRVHVEKINARFISTRWTHSLADWIKWTLLMKQIAGSKCKNTLAWFYHGVSL